MLGKTTMANLPSEPQSPSQWQGGLGNGSSLAGWRLVGRREIPSDDWMETWWWGDFSGSFYKGFCYKAVYDHIKISLSSSLQSVQKILHLLHVISSVAFSGTWSEPIGENGRTHCNVRAVLDKIKPMFIFFTELSPRYYGKYFDFN